MPVKPHPTWIMLIVMLVGFGFLLWDCTRPIVVSNVVSDVALIAVAGGIGWIWARANEEM